jgi:hypothetical protein
VDDEIPMRLLRLFNEKTGREALIEKGLSPEFVNRLDLLGISGVGNMIAAIKYAKYNELTEDDCLVSIATDSMQLYESRLAELASEKGEYSNIDAWMDIQLLDSVGIDHVRELAYYDKKSIHNLKYYTWIEQQGKAVEELNAQWYDHANYWETTFKQVEKIDALINEFNDRVGIITT